MFWSKKEAGQVGLAIILVMVVVSTIGLSVASRSTQEVSLSRQGQEAIKTFEAAESAIERVLSESADAVFDFAGDSQTYNYDDIQQDADADLTITKKYNFEGLVDEGSSVEVDVSTASDGNILRLEWSNSRECGDTPAAMIIKIINTDSGSAVARYLSVSACDYGDNLTLIDGDQAQYQGSTHALRYDFALQAGDELVRVMPVYGDTPLSLASVGWTLPVQQYRIQSVGQNTAQGGRETKAIEVERSQPYAAGILDYTLVSGSSITK